MQKIIATNNTLKSIIQKEIMMNDEQCSLNHIDVSQVTEMSGLFYSSAFNGDLRPWKWTEEHWKIAFADSYDSYLKYKEVRRQIEERENLCNQFLETPDVKIKRTKVL